MLSISSMTDCCWKYLQGVNHMDNSRKNFRMALLKGFNDGLNMQNWEAPTNFPGAILFAGSHSGNWTGIGQTSTKATVIDNLEEICTWIEDDELGEIVEIPEFKNHLHKSTMLPRMWIINNDKLRKALIRWDNERTKTDKVELW